MALVSFPLRAGCDCALTTIARVSLSVFQLSVLYVAPTETRPVDLQFTRIVKISFKDLTWAKINQAPLSKCSLLAEIIIGELPIEDLIR